VVSLYALSYGGFVTGTHLRQNSLHSTSGNHLVLVVGGGMLVLLVETRWYPRFTSCTDPVMIPSRVEIVHDRIIGTLWF